MLTYVSGAELGSWEATVPVNGATVDFSTGWTFQVTAAALGSTTALFTKTTGITGTAAGVITVAWGTTGELNALTAGSTYDLQLRARRTADSRDLTVEEQVKIRAAHA